MKKFIATVLASLLAVLVFSQVKNNPWQDTPEQAFARKSAIRNIIPSKYRTLSLDPSVLNEILAQAPLRFTAAAAAFQPSLRIPMPDGALQRFKIVEAPVMHPDLTAKYPYIRSYAGWSEEDPTAYLRFGVTQKGFHAVVFSARHSTVYIDAFAEGDTEHYTCYFKKDFYKNDPFECLTGGTPVEESLPADVPAAKTAGDCQLRTYALALACTGEYAQYHGGTVPSVMAEYAIAMTRVNGIYEREATVTMELVPNTDLLIFLDAATDPYNNGNGGAMLNQNQQTCNNIIGNANYDIGHVFSTGGGGIASLNSVCSTNNKARGVTGGANPTNDPFWVDYVAHEMGHQFGGNHTQNNSCNRNNATAMEPGSASTIMGYAGICAPNVQSNSDDYFHAISLDEITSHITGSGNSCATTASTGNNNPSVSVLSGAYQVPVSTPLVLTAIGADADGDALTYCWEQMNNQVASMPPQPGNTGGPAFRSFSPQESPSRYLPALSAVVGNTTPTWEVLPAVSRTMFFRCTVRDNFPGASCTAEADVILNFTADAGPFLVSEPNTGAVTWTATTQAIVTWDVANTDAAPVNCSEVEILLSVDGGFTYPYLLLAQTLNDGTETVQVPNVATSQARVMVRSVNNVFYDISNENFTILAPTVPSFLLDAAPAAIKICESGEAVYTLTLQEVVGFNESVTFSAAGIPAGASVTFLPENPIPPAVVTMTVSDLGMGSPGDFPITITAVSQSETKTAEVLLTVIDSLTKPVILFNPADDAPGQVFDPTPVTWFPLAGAEEYVIEVAMNPSFQTLFHTNTVSGTGYSIPGTAEGEVYYWRVKGMNLCNEGPFSAASAFQTGMIVCEEFVSTKTPIPISATEVSTVSDGITVPDGTTVAWVKVHLDIAHTYVGDLIARLESPQGNQVVLFDRPGEPASNFGCNGDDLLIDIYDEAPNPAVDLENACDPGSPAIIGDFQPVEPLLAFQGQNSSGNWTLFIEDVFEEDGGEIRDWSIEICSAVSITPAFMIHKEILIVDQGQSETITQAELLANGDIDLTVFTLVQLPENGILFLQGVPLQLGDTFTQAQINAGLLTYEHNGSATSTDFFLFDVLDDANGWLHAQIFQIQILEVPLSATAVLTQPVDCNNAANAVITVNAVGGVAPLMYALNGGSFQAENVFENLASGIYTLEVMDVEGTVFTTNEITIGNPPAIIADAVVIDDDVTITASGGTGTFLYSVNGGAFQSSNSFENLPNGTFDFIVQDANGCTATVSATVSVNSLVISAAVTQPVSCFGENDGEITAIIQSGTAPYSYSLNGGGFQTEPVFQNLSPGSYTLTVQDGDGLIQTTLPVTLAGPSPVSASALANGYTVEVMASGGTGSLVYSLDGGAFQAENVFFPVLNGDYTVLVMDENGCETSVSVSVSVPALTAGVVVSQNVSCWNSSDGQITGIAGGGVPTYTYSLNGSAFQNDPVFSNLAPGNYTLTIQDIGGFTATVADLVLTAPPVLSVTAGAFDSTVTATASGGTPPYQYQLDGGGLQPSNEFLNVAEGDYLVQAVDANTCETAVSVTVLSIPPPVILVVEEQGLVCSDGSTAVISANVSGGLPPFQFSLNGGAYQSGNIFENLPAGSYEVAVQDALGNVFMAPALVVSGPLAITASAGAFGLVITVTAGGGTGSLQYSLDGLNFQEENTFVVASNAVYTVTIVDENGCRAEVPVEVNILSAVQFGVSSPSCFGLMDGAITIQGVTGGIPPYLYSLNGGPFTASLNYAGLAPGEYVFTVEDATGYQFEAPPVEVLAGSALTAVTVIDGNMLTINASGGVGDYLYSVNGGQSYQDGNVFENLANGDYEVVVIDGNGCAYGTNVNINISSTQELKGALVFEVFPNPSDGLFNLRMEFSTPTMLHLAVFDVAGKLVFHSKMEGGGRMEEQLDLRFLASGSYELRVNSSSGWGVKRLVIAK